MKIDKNNFKNAKLLIKKISIIRKNFILKKKKKIVENKIK